MKTIGRHTPPQKTESSPTVGDIVRASHRLHLRQHKVMYDIEHCRRGEFGTHWKICDACGHLEKGYNSCRNRACPNRIIALEDDVVRFWFKNTRKKSRWEATSLPVMEFIKLFLFHVLPKHFHRIRHYGFLANGKAGKQISSIRQALNDRKKPASDSALPVDQACQCPACGNGTMTAILVLDGFGNVVKEAAMAGADQTFMAAGSP